MTYEARTIARPKVRYDSANADLPLVYQLTVDGAKVTPDTLANPSVHSITVYQPGNATALIGPVGMTPSGTLLSYALNTTTEATWPVSQGYRADLAIVYGSTTYYRHFLFDIARHVFVPNIGFDQLAALDDGIVGMSHNGDEDFSPLIQAMNDELEVKIEAKILNAGKMLVENIIDVSSVAVAQRRRILGQIWANKNGPDDPRAVEHKTEGEKLLAAVLSTLKFDVGQSGEEGGASGGIAEVRWI